MPATRSTAWAVASLRTDPTPLWLRHRGSSMAPALRHGDRLLVEAVRADGLRPGDIAVVLRAGRLVAHRCIGRSDGRVVTRGDACAVADFPITPDLVFGRVLRRRGSVSWLLGR